MQTTTAPAAAAIAEAIIESPSGDRQLVTIICTHFDTCELAQKVAQQHPGYWLLSANWKQ